MASNMGTWKKRIILSIGRSKSEKTKKAKIYIARPPAEGWPGGDPRENGWKGKKRTVV